MIKSITIPQIIKPSQTSDKVPLLKVHTEQFLENETQLDVSSDLQVLD